MKNTLWKIYVAMQVLNDERGQDLVEYALVVAIIALGAVTTMQTLGNDINNAFSAIGSKLAAAT